MSILAIDPGSTESGWVAFESVPHLRERVLAHGKWPNEQLLDALRYRHADLHLPAIDIEGARTKGIVRAAFRIEREPRPIAVAIEWVQSYGAPVGMELFETIWWAGQFAEAAWPSGVARVPRMVVKKHLAHQRAKDAEIRGALVDRFGGIGGRAVAIGTKAQPGPLYGVTADRWAALAVAVTFCDLEAEADSGILRSTPGA